MPPKKGYKQSPEHAAKRLATRAANPANAAKMVVISCRFCGEPREVRTKDAAKITTCGSRECTKRRRVEGGSKSKGQGTANPRYVDGEWVQTEKVCEICGIVFVGPAKRRFCTLACSAKAKTAVQAGQVFPDERRARMKGRSGTGPKTEAWKAAASERFRGERNPMWLGIGQESRSRRDRNSHRYKDWRIAVLERDRAICRTCGTEKDLVAHHIKEWWCNPDLRYTVENGITLCISCHTRVHHGSLSLPG